MKFKIGDKVLLRKGKPLYKSSTSVIATSFVKEDKITYITRVAPNTKHPYNTTGDLGWCDESSLTLEGEVVKKEVECTLVDKDGLIDYIENHPDDYLFINGKQLKEVLKS